METILINPGEVKRWNITHILLNTKVWPKDKADEYIKERYRYYEYLGEAGGYHQYRVIPKSELEEIEKKAREIRGSKDIYRMLQFGPPEHGVRALAVLAIPKREKVSVISEPEEDTEMLENPVRKITPEIEEAIAEYRKKKYKISQIRALIKEKFNIELSPSSIRNIFKKYGLDDIGELEEKTGGENMAGLPSELMKEARAKWKAGEFKSLGEAMKWAWSKFKGTTGEYKPTRVVSEVLINKAKKTKSKGGAIMKKAAKKTIGESSIKKLTTAINSLVETISAARKRRRRRTAKSIGEPEDIGARRAKEPGVHKPFREEMGEDIRRAFERIKAEESKFYEELGSKLRAAWATPEGEAFKRRLREELRKVWGVSELSSEELEALAMLDLAESIEAWKPFIAGSGLKELVGAAWRTPEAEAFRPILKYTAGAALKRAWATPEGLAFKQVLSRAVREARARMYPTTPAASELEELAEAIEQTPPVTPPPPPPPRYPAGYTPPTYTPEFKEAIRRAVRGAWHATPEGAAFLPVIRRELAAAWTTPEAAVVKEKLSKAIKEIRAKYYPGEATSALIDSLANIGALSDIGQFDLVSLFGFDWLIPGGVGIISEAWIGWGIRQLAKLPFGKDADNVFWKRALYNLLAGAIHYAGVNYVFNTFFKGNEFMNKVRVAYTMCIYRDIFEATLGQFLPTPNREVIRALEAKIKKEEKKQEQKPTGEIDVGQGEFVVVNLDRLEVDEEGNLIVPLEYYRELTETPTVYVTAEVESPTEKVEEEYEQTVTDVLGEEEEIIIEQKPSEEIEIQGVEEA